MIARRLLLSTLPALGVVAALDACSSAPPAQYFRLAPVPGVASQATAKSIQIRNIGIPGYLNQNGIAQPSSQYQFNASANALWAEPLAQILQTLLVQNLAQRLPGAIVTSSSGMVGTTADLLVEVNVLRFDPDSSGRISLSAQVALKDAKDGHFIATNTWQTSMAPDGPDGPAMMAAMSTLWAGFSDMIVKMVPAG